MKKEVERYNSDYGIYRIVAIRKKNKPNKYKIQRKVKLFFIPIWIDQMVTLDGYLDDAVYKWEVRYFVDGELYLIDNLIKNTIEFEKQNSFERSKNGKYIK